MQDIGREIESVLEVDVGASGFDPGTFSASQIGFCPRQLYLAKLGLTNDANQRGKYRSTAVLRNYLVERLAERNPHLEAEPRGSVQEGSVRFVGRATFYDPAEDAVYALKFRNGWYKFSPPNRRHLDQLYIYMACLDAGAGQLVYLSKNDIQDLRTWPPRSDDTELEPFDPERYAELQRKAKVVRDEIIANGVATAESAIPFGRCDCYFCESESLALPAPPADEPASSGYSDVEGAATAARSAPDEQVRAADGGIVTESSKDTSVGADLDVEDQEARFIDTTGTHHPADLCDLPIWVVWDGREKLVRAPWETDTMFPCEWAEDKDVNPRATFRRARSITDIPVDAVARTWPFPDDLPDQLLPAILLPHDADDVGVTAVDFDGVRDPDTGRVTGEVASLLDELGGYAETSISGTGVHVYVGGTLPEGIGAFAAPLEEEGSIEMYDHGRLIGGTWKHLAGSPQDRVPEAQDTLTQIVARYG